MTTLAHNPIANLLQQIGISSLADVEMISDHTRDRADVRVMRCRESGVIFLDSPAMTDAQHYAQIEGFDYWGSGSRTEAIAVTARDDKARVALFGDLIRGKRWMDVGTGPGGILDLLADAAAQVFAVEPQPALQQSLLELGYSTYDSLASVPHRDLQVITLFHVLEHMDAPIDELRHASSCLADDGVIVIEVPHARDALMSRYDLDAFREFTFWSEHLILHTRESLRAVIEAAGLRVDRIDGVQRYPLSNHLHWLRHGKPGGHVHWADLDTPELTAAYERSLAALDQTDTLVAYAVR